jgi:hypothetical protein
MGLPSVSRRRPTASHDRTLPWLESYGLSVASKVCSSVSSVGRVLMHSPDHSILLVAVDQSRTRAGSQVVCAGRVGPLPTISRVSS